MSITGFTPPSNGDASLGGDGRYITFTADPAFTDGSFDYTIEDAEGYTSVGTIWLSAGAYGSSEKICNTTSEEQATD